MLEALKNPSHSWYGADADHIKVTRGGAGLSRAKQVVAAARYYTFFTLDLSDILDHSAMAMNSAGIAEAYLSDKVQDSAQLMAVLDYHQRKRRFGGLDCERDPAMIGRLVGKYWGALEASQELTDHVGRLKGDRPFDLELAIDEQPPGVPAVQCITTDAELLFVLLEVQRRGLPVTHIAPNVGIEKGADYRGRDGLEGLEKRIRSLASLADDFGVILDFHSGDDLTVQTRRVIQRATKGHLHLKISPVLQSLFAEVLIDFHPALFQRWWDDALAYARREAEAESALAIRCLRQYEASSEQTPSPHHDAFHHYSFAFVGRRDSRGQFLNREAFYDLSPEFYREYRRRVNHYLCRLATDVLGHRNQPHIT